MSEKDKLIEKARKLGKEYLHVYRGCAQTTLLAVADTLKMEVSDDLFKAMVGLSGRTGGCGGICGATAAIGLYYGINREDFVKEPEKRGYVSSKINESMKIVREKMTEKYGGYLCSDIQKTLYGRSYDFVYPEEMKAFRKEPIYDECPKVTEDTAGWTVEAILNTG
jgi:C_GCAxxG_C_C family probable redox protein